MQQKSIKVLLKFSIITLLGILLQLSAKASPSCLKQVSNSELVDELQNRLNSTTPIENSGNALTATCSGTSLVLRLVNLSTGSVSDNFSAYVGSAETCNRLTDSLLSVTDRSFSRAFIITTCDGTTIIKTSVSESGRFKKISSDYVGSSEICLTQAVEANRRLNAR